MSHTFSLAIAFLLVLIVALTFANNDERNTYNLHAYRNIDTNRRKLDISVEGYGYTCTHKELKKIMKAEPINHNTNCPSRNWLDPFVNSIQNVSKTPTIIIVGCNKGEDFVNIVNKLSGNSKYDTNEYVSKLVTRNIKFNCGGHGSIVKVSKSETPKNVYGYCIEPLDVNIKLVQDIFKEMNFDSKDLHIVKRAMNSYTGTVEFPKNVVAGVSVVGMESESSSVGTTDIVPMSNLDTFIKEYQINEVIDFVSIDTEGFDAEVILGFSKTLVNKYVRLIEFEYHIVNRWKTADLQMIITMLDLWNFDCYWQGNKDQIWRLTGCWHNNYYINRQWSNVVCINRKETAHAWFVEESKKWM